MGSSTLVESDATLVSAVLDGDQAAFAVLYRTHAGAVARVVRDNVHDPEEVTDLVQEVFTRALERLPRLRDPQRFRPWLFSIARHAAVDARRGRRPVQSFGDGEPEPLADDHGPEELAEVRELARLVECCVAGLSRRDATALSLVTHLGFSPAEIATAMRVSVGAAKVLVHRARCRLRDALAVELMVRHPATACGFLQGLIRQRALGPAARHLSTCHACTAAVHAEAALYGTSTAAQFPF